MDVEAVEALANDALDLHQALYDAMHPAVHVDPEYVTAIEMIMEDENVPFPLIAVADLCTFELEDKLIRRGCPEHIYCATPDFAWSYTSYDGYNNPRYRDNPYTRRVYLNGLRRPKKNKTLKDGGVWEWRFMDENQGCCEWVLTYDHKYDPCPVVWCREYEGANEVTREGTWQEFVKKRCDDD